MMKRLILACALMASAASGCVLYDGDGDDEPCAVFDPVGSGLRNPVNGECEWFGGGGGGSCGAIDGGAADEAPGALPDMASCPGACEALDEQTCLATSACRAAYQDESGADCAPGVDCGPTGAAFLGCWGTAPSGPIQGGGCSGLDAWACARHDDCTAHYATDWDGDGAADPEAGISAPGNVFAYCADEAWAPGCYSNMDCPAGWECSIDVDCTPPPGGDGDSWELCAGRCEPATNGCEAVDCAPGYHCELQCYPCDEADPSGGEGADAPEPPPGCDAACEVTCVPDEVMGCEAILCGPGTHCETVCADAECPPGSDCPTTCWSDCVANDPGSCEGEVLCDALPPACPDGTVPGISDGCWSGYCIPTSDCGQTTPSCSSLADQASCAARTDCQPVYDGAGCTCFPDGSCSCEEWSYARCEARGDDPVMPF